MEKARDDIYEKASIQHKYHPSEETLEKLKSLENANDAYRSGIRQGRKEMFNMNIIQKFRERFTNLVTITICKGELKHRDKDVKDDVENFITQEIKEAVLKCCGEDIDNKNNNKISKMFGVYDYEEKQKIEKIINQAKAEIRQEIEELFNN